LGYSLISVREKLKPEYLPLPGPEIANLRKQGVEIQYRLEVPLFTYLGDTSAGPVFDHPDVQNAEVLLTEVTFFDPDHKARAKAGKHLHVDHFLQLLPKLKNGMIVLLHVSRRTGVRRARRQLAKLLPPEQMARIQFLMDFEGARDGGEVEDAAPPPADTAE
jgi:ribonuclease Z